MDNDQLIGKLHALDTQRRFWLPFEDAAKIVEDHIRVMGYAYIDARVPHEKLLMNLRLILAKLRNPKHYQYQQRRNSPLAKSLARKIRKLERRTYWPIGCKHTKGEGWFLQPCGMYEDVHRHAWEQKVFSPVRAAPNQL